MDLILVSERKTISGFDSRISSFRALTVEALPAPRQFQAMVLIVRWKNRIGVKGIWGAKIEFSYPKQEQQ